MTAAGRLVLVRLEDHQPLGQADRFADPKDPVEGGVVFDEDQAAAAVADDVLHAPRRWPSDRSRR